MLSMDCNVGSLFPAFYLDQLSSARVICYTYASPRHHMLMSGPAQAVPNVTCVYCTWQVDIKGPQTVISAMFGISYAATKSSCVFIWQVTEETSSMRFNTGIAAMMGFVNGAYKWEQRPRRALEQFVLLLAPYAPHLAEEMWQVLPPALHLHARLGVQPLLINCTPTAFYM